MTAPALAAWRFVAACGVGAGIGFLYGALRPLRPRLTHLADGITVLFAFLGWVYLGFGICHGDISISCCIAMIFSAILWEASVGRSRSPDTPIPGRQTAL